jgi:iron complex outermembrane recepter protein
MNQRLAVFAVVATLFLSAPAALQAQAPAGAAVIKGQVTTRDDGLPFPGAAVSIPALGLSAFTDGEGRFVLTIPADRVTGQTVELRVSAPGFRPTTASVQVASGELTRDLALSPGFAEHIVVGSRASGAEAEKAVAVDILDARQIEATGAVETMQVLQALAPSFNFPRPTVSDGTDSIRPATLRGLGPDHVLVLVNGKRRHQTALVHINNTVGRGATGVDLNAIPVSAIERIEILRDGAAAQYGSDAIAGVINIVLKSGARPLTLSVRGGFNTGSFEEVDGARRDFSDGGTYDGGVSYGRALGRGSVAVSAEVRRRDGTNRAGFDTRDQLVAGDAGRNEVPQPNTHWGDSEENDLLTFANLEVPVNAGQTASFYAFGGWSRRTGVHGGNYRRGLDATNWPQIYPLGFLPLIEPRIVDASATAGLRGGHAKWFWDVSVEYGRNRLDYDVSNSLNVSLGPNVPPNHPSFYSGGIAAHQLVGNLDFSRGFDLGLAGPLNVAFGAEARRESYQIFAGEADSYRDGGVRNQAGGAGAPGAQVFPGFRPSNEIDTSRSNVAGYLDIEGDLLARLRLGLAGRAEHYSDFGDTLDGKVTARLELHKRVVARAAASSGFRAPSLAQSHFSTVSTNFTLVGGTFVPLEIVTAPVDSEIARILGAQDLTPEQSVNLSAGLVLNPVDALDVTFDFYRVRIDDRVVLSGNFTGGSLAALLQAFGAGSARYFTNAIDTRTTGFDLLANYRLDLHAAGGLRLQAAYNRTETKLLRIAPTPPSLADFLQRSQFEAILFNNAEERRFTCGQPEDNLRLSADWTRGRLSTLARASRYGEYCSIEDLPSANAAAQVFAAKWVADLEVSYRKDRYTLGVGAHNAFNAMPDRQIAGTAFNNIRTFPRNAPFGFNGRFLYAKAVYRF